MASLKKKIPDSILIIFICLCLSLIGLISGILFEPLRIIMRYFPIAGLVVFVLSLALIISTKKQKLPKPLKKWLLLTGGSAAGFFLFAVLHNLFDAMSIVTEKWPVVSKIFGLLEGAAFIISVPVCPIVFAIGFVGTILTLLKK